MPTLWDLVLFRMFAGLGEGHAPGHPLVHQLLTRAHTRGQLVVEHLNELSITLLRLVCPADSVLHRAAHRVHQERRRSPLQVWEAVSSALPSYLTDVQHLSHARQAHQQEMLLGLFRTLYLPALVRFMTRTALVEYDVAQEIAETHFEEVFPIVEPLYPHASQPLTLDEGFQVEVYSRLLRSDWPVRGRWPVPPPGWGPAFVNEQVFLAVCMESLTVESRCLLYLSFHAQLNLRTITRIVQEAWDPASGPTDVLHALVGAWNTVLPLLPVDSTSESG